MSQNYLGTLNQTRMEFGQSYARLVLSIPSSINSTGTAYYPGAPVEYQIWQLMPRRTYITYNQTISSFYQAATFQQFVYDGFNQNGMPSGQTNTCYRNVSPLLSKNLTDNFVVTKASRRRILHPHRS